MKRRKPAKDFDCVGFKNRVQAEIYREIKGLAADEEIEYFRRSAAKGPMAKLWKALERSSASTTGEEEPSAKTPTRELTTHRIAAEKS